MLADGKSVDEPHTSKATNVVLIEGPASRLEENYSSREEDIQVDGGVGSHGNKSTKVLVKKEHGSMI